MRFRMKSVTTPFSFRMDAAERRFVTIEHCRPTTTPNDERLRSTFPFLGDVSSVDNGSWRSSWLFNRPSISFSWYPVVGCTNISSDHSWRLHLHCNCERHSRTVADEQRLETVDIGNVGHDRRRRHHGRCCPFRVEHRTGAARDSRSFRCFSHWRSFEQEMK
jgi:hypothetical protein